MYYIGLESILMSRYIYGSDDSDDSDDSDSSTRIGQSQSEVSSIDLCYILTSPLTYAEIRSKVSIPYSKYPRLYLYLYSCICYVGKRQGYALQKTPPCSCNTPAPIKEWVP